jgi:hypothetical protein
MSASLSSVCVRILFTLAPTLSQFLRCSSMPRIIAPASSLSAWLSFGPVSVTGSPLSCIMDTRLLRHGECISPLRYMFHCRAATREALNMASDE